jgi:hypothetical protein
MSISDIVSALDILREKKNCTMVDVLCWVVLYVVVITGEVNNGV